MFVSLPTHLSVHPFICQHNEFPTQNFWKWIFKYLCHRGPQFLGWMGWSEGWIKKWDEYLIFKHHPWEKIEAFTHLFTLTFKKQIWMEANKG